MKKLGYFADLEIWENGNKRFLIEPKTKEIKFSYEVKRPIKNQLELPLS